MKRIRNGAIAAVNLRVVLLLFGEHPPRTCFKPNNLRPNGFAMSSLFHRATEWSRQRGVNAQWKSAQ